MRKAARLFELVTLLRGRRLAITAETIAEVLEVSVRTVYRDIAALAASGVPIESAAGVGYRLAPGYHLPPLMFSGDEVQALIVGAEMVAAFTEPALGSAAASALAKIRAVLDDAGRARADAQPYRVPRLARDDGVRALHARLRAACDRRDILVLDYTDAAGAQTERRVWPLGLIGWTGVWTLLAWCELRQDYRNFRFDRILNASATGAVFVPHPNRSLAHYLARLGACPPGVDGPLAGV